MTNEIKITPDTDLPKLAKDLAKLAEAGSLGKPTYIDEGDGVKIIYGEPKQSGGDKPQFDPNMVMFEPRSEKEKAKGKGTTYGEYAEMKAKSILYDIISKKGSEKSAALVFSILAGDLFAKDSLFSGEKESVDLSKKLTEEAQSLHRQYFDVGLGEENLEGRHASLHKRQNSLFKRDLELNRSRPKAADDADPQELAAELKIVIRDPKAKKAASAASAPSHPQQASVASSPQSKSPNTVRRRKPDPRKPARKTTLAKQGGPSLIWPKPSRNKEIWSDTPESGSADRTNWHAQFSIPCGNDGVYGYREDLAARCRQLAIEIIDEHPQLESTVYYRFDRILASADERHKLESVIHEQLKGELADEADQPDSKVVREASNRCLSATKLALTKALTEPIPENEDEFVWPKFLSDQPIWSDTWGSPTSDTEDWHAQFDVPTAGGRSFAFAVDLKKHCQEIIDKTAKRNKGLAKGLKDKGLEILSNSAKRSKIELEILEELKHQFKNDVAMPNRKTAFLAKQKAEKVTKGILAFALTGLQLEDD